MDDPRLTAHEKTVERIDSKLDRLIASVTDLQIATMDRFGAIESRLSRIEVALEAKASASEVADLRGSIKHLPSIWQTITLVFVIMGGAFAITRFGLPHP
jgi:hypothetical protein